MARRWMRGLMAAAVAAPVLAIVTSIATPSVVSAAEECGNFVDVPASNAFCVDIAWMAERGISTGYPNGTYRPDEPVNRSSMAAFMARLAGDDLDDCTTAPFTDVPAAHLFCREITWMVGEEITGGYPDGTFRPGAPVTRGAMAAFMARLAGVDVGPCSYAPFPDVPASHQFCSVIRWMANQAITGGYPDGTFRPGAVVTRGAMSAFMHRFAPRYTRSFADCSSVYTITVPECEALQAIHYNMNGDDWSYETYRPWFSDNNPCRWAFVTCVDGTSPTCERWVGPPVRSHSRSATTSG